MLQKEKSLISASPHEMINVGDFYFEPNPELTSYLLAKMFEKPASQDLAKICLEWCKKSKKKLSSFDIVNNLGEITHIAPINHSIVGAW